jgi:MurNAc alpha-1-phosphate uridylyltransferase
MLLAAGRGERMRPLTDHCPKPLLKVRGKALMQWHLEALARGACDGVVVNTAWLGDQIIKEFGDSFPLHGIPDKHKQLLNSEQLHIDYSNEGRDFGGALETAGGIVRALPRLSEVFWLLAGDVFAPDFIFCQEALARFIQSGKLAHLWLVPNPEHNPRGDFGLAPGPHGGPDLALNLAPEDARPRYTYSTIGLYRRGLFELPWCDIPAGNPTGVKAALAPLLRLAMNQQQVSAELFEGAWTDVGTPQRLAQLNENTHVIRPL